MGVSDFNLKISAVRDYLLDYDENEYPYINVGDLLRRTIPKVKQIDEVIALMEQLRDQIQELNCIPVDRIYLTPSQFIDADKHFGVKKIASRNTVYEWLNSGLLVSGIRCRGGRSLIFLCESINQFKFRRDNFL